MTSLYYNLFNKMILFIFSTSLIVSGRIHCEIQVAHEIKYTGDISKHYILKKNTRFSKL